MKKLILASTSSYRKSLLERLFLSFDCVAPDVDEAPFKKLGLPGEELAEKLSFEKANSVFEKNPDAVVIGSDQVLDLDGTILSKPGTVEKACEQLTLMSGKSHSLITGVTVLSSETQKTFSVKTTLKLRQLTKDEIETYVKKDMPLSCAGSYMIEGLGITLFEKIESPDFTSIEGLPLLELSKVLREQGYSLP